MKDIIYVVCDIATYFVQGLLLVMLLRTAQARFSFQKTYVNDAIPLIQYMVIQLFLHYSDWVKSLLYGESMIMNSSRQSIVPILVSMLVTCVAGLFFIAENQIDKIFQ